MNEIGGNIGYIPAIGGGLGDGGGIGGGVGVPAVYDKFYMHVQATAAAEWTVAHNLHKRPAVTVVDSADSVVVGAVEYIDENNVKITFSAAFSGRAYCN